MDIDISRVIKRKYIITDPDSRMIPLPRNSSCEEIFLYDCDCTLIPGAAWRDDDQTVIIIDPRASLDQYPLHLEIYDI